jgi:hypothetical protein
MNKETLISLLPDIKAEILDKYEQKAEITDISIEEPVTDGEDYFVVFELRFQEGLGSIYISHKPIRRINFDERTVRFEESISRFQCYRDLVLKNYE